jgi:alternate signal-mediated exported protein
VREFSIVKKVTKATIAAAAAGVLLLGGAGTVALWSGTGTIDAGEVSTGHLTLNSTAPGTWTDGSSEMDPEADNTIGPTLPKLVPGDVFVYSQTVNISAEGKNLKGELTAGGLTEGSILPGDVAVDVVVDGSAAGLTQVGNVISFDAAGDYLVPVTVTVTFDKAATDTMNARLDLGSMALTLNQIRP